MMLETEDRVAVLLVWSSGEADLEYGDVATGCVRQKHRDLRTFEELLNAIESVHEWIQMKGEWFPKG
ncbi:hypothetical protein ACYCCF_15010 [Streptomyces argenteolus]|uniref:hypothetical protein n=1 Tax=Streptomyces sp. NPDC025273 TaxID=3155251 RepID=UPI0033CD1B3A